MKKITFLPLLALCLFSCSDDDEQVEEIVREYPDAYYEQAPTIELNNYDITHAGVYLDYLVENASILELRYKEKSSEEWKTITTDIAIDESNATVLLKGLTFHSFYDVEAIAHNFTEQTASVSHVFEYYYNSLSTTYFKQPFLTWGASVQQTRKSLIDQGNEVDSLFAENGRCLLTCKPKYKELRTEYILDTARGLENVMVYFDRNRVSTSDMTLFVSGALGYLSFGNIHVEMNGEVLTFPLYKTSEGKTYVFVYERDNRVIVDFLPTSEVDPGSVLVK